MMNDPFETLKNIINSEETTILKNETYVVDEVTSEVKEKHLEMLLEEARKMLEAVNPDNLQAAFFATSSISGDMEVECMATAIGFDDSTLLLLADMIVKRLEVIKDLWVNPYAGREVMEKAQFLLEAFKSLNRDRIEHDGLHGTSPEA